MVEINIDLELDGEISEEELDMRLKILGELIINKVKENIRQMGLIKDGQYLQGWLSEAKGGELIIENTKAYSDFIEFGWLGYWQQHGLNSFTDPPHPKKRDMTPEQRKQYPSGGQAWAPLRKVLFNESIMQELVDEAFS